MPDYDLERKCSVLIRPQTLTVNQIPVSVFWEYTGGEPDVVSHDKKMGEYIFLTVQQKVLTVAEVIVTTVKAGI